MGQLEINEKNEEELEKNTGNKMLNSPFLFLS